MKQLALILSNINQWLLWFTIYTGYSTIRVVFHKPADKDMSNREEGI
jgi:hypothetical protein